MTDDKGPFKVNLGAKLEIKTEVPSDASGRLVHAVTDAISPLTEWLGMMGDRVRIHRHIVAARTIKRAEELIALEDRPIELVPTKIAVPLLEHASQEEPDDNFMIELWAKLLASATAPGSIPPRFVSLLSELDGRQAQALLDVNARCESFGVWTHENAKLALTRRLGSDFPAKLAEDPDTVEKYAEQAGVYVVWADYRVIRRNEREVGSQRPAKVATPALQVDIAILESLGLLDTSQFMRQFSSDAAASNVTVETAIVSPLGKRLLQLARPAPRDRKDTNS